jgi:hypothetical protein
MMEMVNAFCRGAPVAILRSVFPANNEKGAPTGGIGAPSRRHKKGPREAHTAIIWPDLYRKA